MTLHAAAPPLAVQRDHTLLVRTDGDGWDAARDALRPFAELVRLGGGVAHYRLTPLSLWNAAALGLDAADVAQTLHALSGDAIPPATMAYLHDTFARAGMLRLQDGADGTYSLHCDDAALLTDIRIRIALDLPPLTWWEDGTASVAVSAAQAGAVKVACAACGYPVRDETRACVGDAVSFALDPAAPPLRAYQRQAVRACIAAPLGGVVVLPCGAGKTLVGVAAAAHSGSRTLVLCPTHAIAAQWEQAFQRWTTLPDDAIAVFRGVGSRIAPVTIATYHALTARRSGETMPRHLGAFLRENWGLVIYDEAHTLPAAGFRLCASAAMQARRRLGLSATLVREDGRETDLFALIGPALFSRPWRELEAQGWIAPARCIEVRVPLAPGWPPDSIEPDAHAIALNPAKDAVIEHLVARHDGEPTLIIGAHLGLLHRIGQRLRLPVVTGAMAPEEREQWYTAFRAGKIAALVVSNVAKEGIDLPTASVAIQVSGTFGSRQEEAQRLGRILRPNADGRPSTFYALVTQGTDEMRRARHRQLFLSEQGYVYEIEHAQ